MADEKSVEDEIRESFTKAQTFWKGNTVLCLCAVSFLGGMSFLPLLRLIF